MPRLARLPIFGWAALSGEKQASLPCLLDQPNIVFTSSGQTAIGLALRDLAVGRGDQVLVPTYHCPTMIAPVVASGAHPVYFALDDAGTPRIDILAQQDLSRVRAMIAAHYFGLPQPMAAIRQFCDKHGIALIEDCAHAMFGEADGRPIGTWGHYAIASLPKFLPTAEGGCLVYREHPGAAPVLQRRTVADQIRTVANTLEPGATYRRMPGLNRVIAASLAATAALRSRGGPAAAPHANGQTTASILSRSAAAAAGPATLVEASAWTRWIAHAAHRGRIVAHRRRNYLHLAALLADAPGARVLQPALPEYSAPYVFPLWVAAPARSYQQVRRAGIPVFRWDDVWPDTPMIPGDVGSDWAVHVFQLGCHQDLDLDDLAAMADTLRTILAEAEG